MERPNKKTLDATARRFLGSNLDEVRVIAGQKADEKKLVASQERYLLAEACQFGDILVRYTMAHRKLSFEQRAWGFALSLFCIRGDFPEGLEDFDELADQGGNDLELSHKNVVTDAERASRIAKELPEFSQTGLQDAAGFAEQVSKYVETKKHQMGLSNPQAAYGLGRAFHNLRLGYPLSEGGTAAFDELTRRASGYYERFK
jgi:hypothetical protein